MTTSHMCCELQCAFISTPFFPSLCLCCPPAPRLAGPPQLGDKAEEAAQLRSAAAAADAARVEAQQAAAAAQAAAEEAAAALSRAERKLVLLGKDRDGLKGILASYDEEYLNQHGEWMGESSWQGGQLGGWL